MVNKVSNSDNIKKTQIIEKIIANLKKYLI